MLSVEIGSGLMRQVEEGASNLSAITILARSKRTAGSCSHSAYRPHTKSKEGSLISLRSRNYCAIVGHCQLVSSLPRRQSRMCSIERPSKTKRKIAQCKRGPRHACTRDSRAERERTRSIENGAEDLSECVPLRNRRLSSEGKMT